MPIVDLPLVELEQYRPQLSAPSDLASRWKATLEDARRYDVAVTVQKVDAGLSVIDVYDVTFAGFGGDRIHGWLQVPAGGTEEPLPVVLEYQGYGGGRGLPHERILWAAAGYAHFVMDTRGQGSAWGSGGVTPDIGGMPEASAPAHPGFMTRGVRTFEGYYYRRVITDAVRAVDAVRTIDLIDPRRIVVAGMSQGGGLALAVSGLADGLAAVLTDVPFLCHIRRGVEISDADPYGEVARYLSVHRDQVDAAFHTLSYVDAAHLGGGATAPALFSVALMDSVCPPSTVFAAFHSYGGPAQIEVYPFNGHEGGQGHHELRQLAWLRQTLGR